MQHGSEFKTVWRITTQTFAAQAFTGDGARLYGGRWNEKGWALVYTAQSQSLALLEMLVQDDALRAQYVLIPARIPATLAVTTVRERDLPSDWRTLQARAALQAIGQQWLMAGKTAVLDVPSAVLPAERNYLLNPRHPDFKRIKIGKPQSLQADTRLLRNMTRL